MMQNDELAETQKTDRNQENTENDIEWLADAREDRGDKSEPADETQKSASQVQISKNRMPHKKLSTTVTGKPYLEFVVLAERIIFDDESPASKRLKETRILELALQLLKDRVTQMCDQSGEAFVRAEDIRGWPLPM